MGGGMKRELERDVATALEGVANGWITMSRGAEIAGLSLREFRAVARRELGPPLRLVQGGKAMEVSAE